MKKTSIHHEILLFTCTSLANKQLTDVRENTNEKMNSPMEELEKACWNGIIYEIFPEILSSFYPNYECFMWHVLTGKNFLYASAGGSPVMTEQESSIDPYLFMMNACEN